MIEGKRLRLMRDRLGATQKECANELGVTWTTISNLENGKQGVNRASVLYVYHYGVSAEN